jgi:tape measure domain-containing protein
LADFEKVWSVRFDTRTAREAVIALHRAIERLDGIARKAEKSIGGVAGETNQGKWRKFGRTAQTALKNIGDTAARAARTLAKGLVIGFGAAAGAATLLVREFSKIENAEAAFTPLLGGAKRAAELVEKLNQTAATTPFQFQTLADSAKQLLPVMNQDIDRTIATLKMLGDTAGGNAQKYESVTRGFTKAMLKGKTDMESLNMIAEAGVPIFTELTKSLGLASNAQLFERIKKGAVSTDDLTNAFQRMTSNGGIFFQGMEIASRTLSGRWSTLKDNISLTAAALGKQLAPTVEKILKYAIDLTSRIREWVTLNRDLINKKLQEFLEVVKTTINEIVQAFRDWRGERSVVDIIADGFRMLGDALVFIMRHWQVISKLTVAVVILIGVIKALSVVLAVINTLAALNPIGLIVLAVIAAIAAFTALVYWAEEVVAWFESIPTPIKMIGAVLMPMLTMIYLIAKAASIIKANWDPIVTWFLDLADQIPDLWNLAMTTVEKTFWQVVKAISDGFNWLARQVTSIINPIIEFFGGSPISFQIDTSSFEADINRLSGEKLSYESSIRNRKAVSHTRTNIEKYGSSSGPGYTDEFSLQSVPQSDPKVSIGDTTINVQTGSGDPDKIAKAVQKRLDRSMSDRLRQASRGAGAMEQ